MANENSSHDDLKLEFETRALHVGQEATQWSSRAVVPPIVMSTTFQQYSPAMTAGFDYGRSGNPTRCSLEKNIASLENGKYGLVFASGLGTQTTITNLLNAGDHILAGDELYGGSNRYFRTVASKFGLTIDYADFQNVNDVVGKLRDNTKLVWFETMTNPLLKVADTETVCKEIKRINPNIIVVVDNTFLSPFFSKPLDFGADISMNSISKYINGHSDVIMGCIATNNEDLYDRLKYLQNSMGIVPSPFDCFLVNRGLKTMALRMEQHQKNALAISEYLSQHPLVKKVIYPGLPNHPQYDLVKRQYSGFGGMVGFYIQGTFETAQRFLKNLNVFLLAESLGAVESLIEIPSLMTHASLPKEVREALGIDDTFLRISVGIENVKDLIEDLEQALRKSE